MKITKEFLLETIKNIVDCANGDLQTGTDPLRAIRISCENILKEHAKQNKEPFILVRVFKEGTFDVVKVNNFSKVVIHDYDVDPECHSEGDQHEGVTIKKDSEGDLFAERIY